MKGDIDGPVELQNIFIVFIYIYIYVLYTYIFSICVYTSICQNWPYTTLSFIVWLTVEMGLQDPTNPPCQMATAWDSLSPGRSEPF